MPDTVPNPRGCRHGCGRVTSDFRPDRPTIADVARLAGVSKGAASLALNGRSGVSDATRERVRGVAAELGWTANPTARALSSARSGAIGWALMRTAKSSTIDPYFMELFGGVELELSGSDVALVVKLVGDLDEEMSLYRRWASERRVDGVLVTDIAVDDQRLDLLADLGLSRVAHQSAIDASPTFSAPSAWSDERKAVRALLDHGYEQGHRRIGWISGDRLRRGPALRAAAADTWAAAHGAAVVTRFTDYSVEPGVRAAVELLRSPDAPTFRVFDNDLLAVSALGALEAAGFRIPTDVSVASFVDSPLCVLSRPAITALRHPIVEYGRALTGLLLHVIDSEEAESAELPAPMLIDRGSVVAPR